MVWKDQKIMLFSSEDEKIQISGWKSVHMGELSVNEFKELF